jgi:hypothetical protein
MLGKTHIRIDAICVAPLSVKCCNWAVRCHLRSLNHLVRQLRIRLFHLVCLCYLFQVAGNIYDVFIRIEKGIGYDENKRR